MKITSEQLRIIESLSCERLSSNGDNMYLVDSFYNVRNESLTNTLQGEAFGEDESNTTAYYVVKNKVEDIVFFFSLKCGMLYDEIIEAEQLRTIKTLYQMVVDKEKDSSLSKEEKIQAGELIETIRSKKGIKREVVERLFHNGELDIDKLFRGNQHQVGKTYSGVELVHFCMNDGFRDEWNRYNMPQPFGSIVFWHFVVPKVMEIMNIAGCEYLFLFAADLSEDENLVNYYRELGFDDMTEHNVAMPIYDLACKFMFQKTNSLVDGKKRYIANFNLGEDAI